MMSAARRVDEGRLWQRLMEMAVHGALPNGGVNRPALSIQDIAARAVMRQWASEHGFKVFTDEIGNLFIRREGRDPHAEPVLTGSHLDSQPKGGKFDGTYGVLAGLEALAAIEDAAVATRRPIEVVAWTNEEGSRFRPGVMGSSVFAGKASLEQVLPLADGAGITVESALREVFKEEPDVARREAGFAVASYVEAHIEQGPVLEELGKTIGVVTGIQGIRWYEVVVQGREDHAGTTPIRSRKDALKSAAAMIGALSDSLADRDDIVRFTVGRFETLPGSPSTVPGRVQFTIDLRHPDQDTLVRLAESIEPTCRAVSAPCEVAIFETMNAAPTAFVDDMVELVRSSAEILGLSYAELPSGAGHDAMNLAAVCPTGMIFIPCEGGISHNEAESATAADCAAGVRVLTACLAELANR